MSNDNNNKSAHDALQLAEVQVDHAKTSQILKSREDYESSGYTEDRDLAVKIFGQVQVHQMYAKIGAAASLADLMYIKENKLYQKVTDLFYVNEDGEKCRTAATWKGYLAALGLKVKTVDDQILDCKTVGEDAYNAMRRIGIGRGTFRKLRQLPEEDRSIIVNEIEVNLGDKDSILSLIDDLSIKHSKEKESLEKEVINLKAKEETNERLFADKNKKIDELDHQLDLAKNKTLDWPKRTFEISAETTRAAFNILQGVDQLHALRKVIQFEDFNEEDKEAAMDAMAIVYYDSVSQACSNIIELMNACEDVFGAYKHQAKPLVEMSHLYVDQTTDTQ